MTEAIRIEILASPTPDLVHRFRNFGEDVYRTLKDKCTLSIKEIDTVSTSIVVSDIRRQESEQ